MTALRTPDGLRYGGFSPEAVARNARGEAPTQGTRAAKGMCPNCLTGWAHHTLRQARTCRAALAEEPEPCDP